MENNKTSKPKTLSQALGTFNGLLTDFLNKNNQLIKHTANFVITATFEMLWEKKQKQIRASFTRPELTNLSINATNTQRKIS